MKSNLFNGKIGLAVFCSVFFGLCALFNQTMAQPPPGTIEIKGQTCLLADRSCYGRQQTGQCIPIKDPPIKGGSVWCGAPYNATCMFEIVQQVNPMSLCQGADNYLDQSCYQYTKYQCANSVLYEQNVGGKCTGDKCQNLYWDNLCCVDPQ